DIIFFRLTEPVGKLTGTVKMSASAMQNIPSDSRLLTFGYPGRHFWAERYPNKYGSMYNADTLFFSQNKLREVDSRYFFAHGHANPGQSGSPVLLYQNGQWVSYGVISFATTGNFWTSYITESIIADNVQHLMDKYDPTNTSILDEHDTPTQVTLNQNYPNPFNSSTTIVYELADVHHVRLEIIDVLGRTIDVLVDDVQQSGRHVVRLNAQNYPSGVFIYRLHTGNHVETRKMTLIK
ncbi:MAG: T9SS type A sorting domain-containing protein, partial [Balneolales bacterium]|nr:T9SS type A sorting domain-containing protein [Balneolales bacterium]